MSEGSLDQATPEELDHMRAMIDTVHDAGGSQAHSSGMSDEEVLSAIDFPGGSAQFAREVRENPDQIYGFSA